MYYINNEFKQLVDPNTYTGQVFQKEGMIGLLRYLKSEHYYQVATVPTNWGVIKENSSLYGKTGFHALIRLPGKRQCEWRKEPSSWKAKFHQIEIRKATGKVIEGIWKTHLGMSPHYHKKGDLISREGISGYMPFFNDCHSYVNRVLRANQQPETTLNRI